jgi:dehydrogenase/reductase SDR family protein 7
MMTMPQLSLIKKEIQKELEFLGRSHARWLLQSEKMLTLLFFSLGALLLIVLLFKFAFADGDFTLISKKHVKREAIQGKVVWITGASRGIGEILAKQFASLDAKLILSARNKAELDRVKSELKGKFAPEDVKVLPLDLASGEESLKHVVEQAVSLFPGAGVDYLVHNAAFERPKSKASDASEETLKTTFDVNVFGTISLTKLVAPHMLKQGGGHFVVISSAAGKVPSPGQAIYSASKHALHGYFHSLRSEFCQKGIKVTVVCPGPIETWNGTGTSTSEDSKSPEVGTYYDCDYLIKL